MPELILKENVSIKNIASVKKELLDAISMEEDIIIDLAQVVRLDLAVVQLIMSAVKTARGKSTAVKFKHVSEEIRSQFQLVGLMKKGKE